MCLDTIGNHDRTSIKHKASFYRIQEHNRSGAGWKMAVNEFSDLTENEFDSLYMGGYKKMPQVTQAEENRSEGSS